MIKEKAIEILKTADFPEDYTIEEVQQALNMAIRALKNEQTDGDLISRKSVITMLQKIENAVEDGDGFQFNEWIEYAKDIPSAEKTAEWLQNPDDMAGSGYFICSNCKNDVYETSDYCPNCGARMGVEQ